MRLQNIVIFNRAPFEQLSLDFGDENVNILSGINGKGKTTLITYIVDSLYELAKNAFPNEFENKEGKYYRVSSRIYSIQRNQTSIVYLRFNKDDGKVLDYIDIIGECSEEEYISHIALDNIIPYSSLRSEYMNYGYKQWSSEDNKEIINLFSSSLLTYFPAYRYETPGYLNSTYSKDLKFKIDANYTGFLPNPIEVISDLQNVSNWIMDIVLDSELYKTGTARIMIDQLNGILSSILSSKLETKTRLGIGPRTSSANRISVISLGKTEKEEYPSIFNMSAGELALLCLFGELVRQADNLNRVSSQISGIVLIDEIDKHLHIKLQREILPRLIAFFPRVQFIISSHSPFFGLGLEESNNIKYAIYDLDHDGIQCPPQENDLFKEIYDIIVKKNDQYYTQYKALSSQIKDVTRPILITEGKTDWKHINAAMRALRIEDIAIDIHECNDDIGDTNLLQQLKDLARFPQPRRVIGMFDRDNYSQLKCDNLKENSFICFGNNVYAFSIPLVHEEVYGNEICIEHYYRKDQLTKVDRNGRRLFLGEEFYETGLSKNSQLHTRCKGIDKKAKSNGIVDDRVYEIANDPKEEKSIALSKNAFAEYIINEDEYANGFDFTSFGVLFDVIRQIIRNT